MTISSYLSDLSELHLMLLFNEFTPLHIRPPTLTMHIMFFKSFKPVEIEKWRNALAYLNTTDCLYFRLLLFVKYLDKKCYFKFYT